MTGTVPLVSVVVLVTSQFTFWSVRRKHGHKFPGSKILHDFRAALLHHISGVVDFLSVLQ